MKAQSDYWQTWQDLWSERSALTDQRTTLENDLSEIKIKLAHLDEILDHLQPLAGVTITHNISSLGITDAIRAVMEQAKAPMSASDVRNALTEKGYDLSSLSAPMSSIYKILGRLHESGQVEREKDSDGRVVYRWKAPEITDDDIPF